MIGRGVFWGLFGPPGLREVVVVALVALVLYGRSGVTRSLSRTRYGRVLRPWMTAAHGATKPKARGWGDRWFWLLAATAVTAVAAWVVTRLLIAGAPGPSH
jgi:hypothetical protein